MVNLAVVIAVGLNAATGQREVLGVDIGPSEDGAFWLRFLRRLVARGLAGVQLVISDSHQGLKGAIAAVLQGASWQRCRTHCARKESTYRYVAPRESRCSSVRSGPSALSIKLFVHEFISCATRCAWCRRGRSRW